MRFPGKGKNGLPFDVRKVALTALATALEEGRDVAKEEKKKGLTGPRAVATGAVLVTAGRAAYKGGRFVRDRLRRDEDEPEAREDEELEDEQPEAEAEPEEEFEEEEPEAEAEPEEEFEEDEAEPEEDFEEEEPEAEAERDEDFEEEEPEAEVEPEEEFEEDEPEAEAEG